MATHEIHHIRPQDRYAYGTQSQIPKTQKDIQRALERYAATDIQWASLSNPQGNQVILRAVLPPFTEGDIPTPLEWRVSWSDDDAKEGRRLWRVLLQSIKARLEEVASGSPVSVAFMPNVLLKAGGTLGERQHQALMDGSMASEVAPLELPGGTR